MDLYLEIGNISKLLAVRDRKILMVKEYNSDETLLENVYGDVVGNQITSLTVSMRMTYIKGERQAGMFLVNQIKTYDDSRMFGVYKGTDVRTIQTLAKAIGLKEFSIVNNVDIYKTLLKGTNGIMVDEFVTGSFIIAPIINRQLATQIVAYEATIEEIAQSLGRKLKVDNFINMLNTDIGKLEYTSYYLNMDIFPDGVMESVAYLLAIPLVKEKQEISIETKIDTSVIEMPVEDVSYKTSIKKTKEEREEEEDAPSTVLGKITSLILALVVATGVLSYTVNGKMSEDIALIQTINTRAETERAYMYQQGELLKHLGKARNKQVPSYAEIYFQLGKVETLSSLTRVLIDGQGFTIEYIVNSEADAKVLIDELTRVVSISDSEVVYEKGSEAYRVIARSKF